MHLAACVSEQSGGRHRWQGRRQQQPLALCALSWQAELCSRRSRLRWAGSAQSRSCFFALNKHALAAPAAERVLLVSSACQLPVQQACLLWCTARLPLHFLICSAQVRPTHHRSQAWSCHGRRPEAQAAYQPGRWVVAAGASACQSCSAAPPHPTPISAAFPTLLKPSAKQRRRSLSDAGPSWASRAARAEPGEAAAAAQAALDALEPKDSGEGVYWSDPLPLPGQSGGSAAAAAAHARASPCAAAAGAADDDMQDTAASPASSCGGAPCSPVAGVMDTCCAGSPAPAFSPLRECTQPCRGCWASRCSAGDNAVPLLPVAKATGRAKVSSHAQCQQAPPAAYTLLTNRCFVATVLPCSGCNAALVAHCGKPRLRVSSYYCAGGGLGCAHMDLCHECARWFRVSRAPMLRQASVCQRLSASLLLAVVNWQQRHC